MCLCCSTLLAADIAPSVTFPVVPFVILIAAEADIFQLTLVAMLVRYCQSLFIRTVTAVVLPV